MRLNLRMFARSTRASDAQIDALRSRLGLDLDPEAASRELLAGAMGADAEAVDRVRARLGYGVPVRARWSAGAVTMAAAALLSVAGGTSAAWWLVDAPLNASLIADTLATSDPTRYVALRYSGDGRLGGSEDAPRIEWTRGVLSVEVEPEQGVRLSVHTAEAEVQVIGTGFDVLRDARGTRVSVEHGRVAVACDGGAGVVLGAGESVECAPTTAAGLLGRAQALRQRGAANAEVLEAAERGLLAPHDAGLAAELTLVRAETLAQLARHTDALAVCVAATTAGAGARQIDLEHLEAREGLRAIGCEAALSPLRRLRERAAASPAELVLLSDCVAAGDPAEARAALIRALQLGVPPDQQDAVVDRLSRVGGKRP